MRTDSKDSIVKTEPGSKPILDPNTATLKDLRARINWIVVHTRPLLQKRADVNAEIRAYDAERNSLADAQIAATARALANGGRA